MRKIWVLAVLLVAGTGWSDCLLKSGERIAFMGDSITELGCHRAGYANLVQCALFDAGIDAVKISCGVSGRKSDDMLKAIDAEVIAQKPDWMTFSCGVNDVWHQDFGKGVSLADYTRNVTAMFDKCAAAGIKVMVFTTTVIGEERDDPRNARVIPYNDFLRAEAKRRGWPLCDLNRAMNDELDRRKRGRALTRDGVHMNAVGQYFMATNVLAAFGVPYDAKRLWELSRWDTERIAVERAKCLVKRMTLEEKAGELMLYDYNCWGTNKWNVYTEHVDRSRIGAIMRVRGAKETKRLQDYKMARSRLGIPMIFHDDITHGYRTILPVQLGNACSWDEDLVEKAEAMVARESAAAGLQMTYAPMVDLSDDPRWGRICETSGEDPYLSARLTAARVRGFQGRTPDELQDRRHIIACDKHFIGYASLQAAKDYRHRDFSVRELYETYVPPHRAAIEAGALGVMNAYTVFNGVPCNFNRFLMQDLLRDELGFTGQLMTDWTTLQFSIDEGAAKNLSDAAVRGLAAGVDMDMIADAYLKLPELVRAGKVKEEDVDRAVVRSLTLKYRMDLFDYPTRYSCEEAEKKELLSERNRETALELARESIVLLENDGVLPLDPTQTVGLTGTWADDGLNMLSEWIGEGKGEESVTLKAAMAKIWGERLADDAETVVLAIGEKSNLTGERHSRALLKLPEQELENLRALKAEGKRIVSVVFAGRPIDMTEIRELSSAVLYAWYPGTMGGQAIAEILAGRVNPSAKLCQHFPKHVGQIPLSYREKRTFIVTGYSDSDTAPLYPFGYGRSYTTFAYAKPTVAKKEWLKGEPVKVSVAVRNTGAREGREVVQLYLRDEVASVLPRERELRGFKSVTLKPGEEKTVDFMLTGRELGLYDADMKWTIEPGDFTAFVGPDSTTTNGVTFTVTDAPGVRVKPGEKIAFLGDSITQFGDFPAGYINMVMLGLEKAGVKAEKIPAGISGHKSSDMLKRLERDVLSKKPDWMTLYCGVNDVWHWYHNLGINRGNTLEEYRRNVRTILDRAEAAGVKVILLTPSMISENSKDERNVRIRPYAEFIRAEAAARGLPLADVSKALWHEVRTAPTRRGHVGSKVTGDGVHMCWYGDRVIAREILKSLGVGETEAEAAARELRKVRGGRYWFGLGLDDAQRADLAARAQKKGLSFDDYVYEKMMGTIGPDGDGKGKVTADAGAKYHRIGVSYDRFEELEDQSFAAQKPLAAYCTEVMMK